MRKHVISGLLVLLFLLALPLSAAAHAVPDESRNGNCSITVSMTYKGKAVRGGTLALYKVGDVAEDDGNYSFVPVEEIQADIPEFGDIESPDLAGRLAELKGKLTPVTSDPVTVDKDGNATFSDLTFGLYLVVQKIFARLVIDIRGCFAGGSGRERWRMSAYFCATSRPSLVFLKSAIKSSLHYLAL